MKNKIYSSLFTFFLITNFFAQSNNFEQQKLIPKIVESNTTVTISSKEAITSSTLLMPNSSCILISEIGITLTTGFNSENNSFFSATTEGKINQKVNIDSDAVGFYPNPNNGVFTVIVGDLQEGVIQIIDSQGIIFKQVEFKSEKEIIINIQEKLKGIYVLKIFSKNQTFIDKIIKI